MKITFWKGVFVADSGPEDRAALEKSGFRLHEPTTCHLDGNCKACAAGIGRRYWSKSVESATRLRTYCNDRALAVMKEHLTRLEKSAAVDANIQIPAPEGLTYLPYQKAGIAYMLQRKDSLNGDEMGTGKTIQTLGWINYVKPKNIIVICPSTLTFNWRDEASRWLVHPYEFCVPANKRDEVPSGDGKLVIINYEKLVGDSPLTQSLKRVWDLAVFDECHFLKNPESQRSQACIGEWGLMRRAHRTIFLSGSPIENYPKEIWPIAAVICPAKFGDRFEFYRRYCGLHSENRGGEPILVATGHARLWELQQRLRTTFMVRRLKKDVLKELPPKRRQLIILEDEGTKWAEHPVFRRWRDVYESRYETKLAALEAATTQKEFEKAVKELEEFVGITFEEMSEFRHQSALAKLPLCLKYIDEMLESGVHNVVVFAHHSDVIETAAKHFGDRASVLYGKTPMHVDGKCPCTGCRKKIVDDFRRGRKKVFISNLKVGGMGINLTPLDPEAPGHDTVVFIEIDWVPGVMTQAEDRLCRIGQRKMVHVVHLVLEGTLDANMSRRVMQKQDVIDRALDRSPELRVKMRMG